MIIRSCHNVSWNEPVTSSSQRVSYRSSFLTHYEHVTDRDPVSWRGCCTLYNLSRVNHSDTKLQIRPYSVKNVNTETSLSGNPEKKPGGNFVTGGIKSPCSLRGGCDVRKGASERAHKELHAVARGKPELKHDLWHKRVKGSFKMEGSATPPVAQSFYVPRVLYVSTQRSSVRLTSLILCGLSSQASSISWAILNKLTAAGRQSQGCWLQVYYLCQRGIATNNAGDWLERGGCCTIVLITS